MPSMRTPTVIGLNPTYVYPYMSLDGMASARLYILVTPVTPVLTLAKLPYDVSADIALYTFFGG